MRLLFAADLAARASGWVALDIGEQPYRVVAHGIVAIKGEWGPLAWEEKQRAWADVLWECVEGKDLPEYHFACIAYESPGRSDIGDGHSTKRMMAQAEALFGAVAAGYTRRIMALDQADVKLAITRQRRADKTQVSFYLELRRQDGEWAAPPDEDGTWSEHEVDALAVGLAAAALLKQEDMA